MFFALCQENNKKKYSTLSVAFRRKDFINDFS